MEGGAGFLVKERSSQVEGKQEQSHEGENVQTELMGCPGSSRGVAGC